MKSPLWEASPGALVALINTGRFVTADLYTLTLTGAADPITFTNADRSIEYPGGAGWYNDSVPVDPQGERGRGRWKRGLDVEQWSVTVMPRIIDIITGEQFPDKIGDAPWTAAAREGALDGADFTVDRAYFPVWPQPYSAKAITPTGVLRIFGGLVGEVDITDTRVVLLANDYRVLLSTQMPRNMYSPQCRYTLFDQGCTLNEATFRRTGTADSGSTRKLLVSANVTAPPPGSGSYSLGRIVFTSGANKGFARTISSWTFAGGASYLWLLNPLPYQVAPGDAFNAWPGCQKTLSDCSAFGNLANYGGQPFIPSPETAI